MNLDPIDEFNSAPVADFDNLSRSEMYQLLYGDFRDCVIRIVDSQSAHDEIPIVQLIDALLDEIKPDLGLKLTAAGYLPVKTVRALYAKRFLVDDFIEHGISKLAGESSSLVISTARVIAELAGFIRKRHGKLFVTKKGIAFRTSKNAVSMLLTTFGETYNLAYSDGYPSPDIAQVGYRFSIYLLKKYGEKPREETFYAERYFRAFPTLVTDRNSDSHCFSVRTFERFLSYFDFCLVEGFQDSVVTKRPLLDQYVETNPSPKSPRIYSQNIEVDWGNMLN